jgi:hypothetical protein
MILRGRSGLRHRPVEAIGPEQILRAPRRFAGGLPAFSFPDALPGLNVTIQHFVT